MVGGNDNGRQKTRNHGYDVIVGGRLFTDYSDHPRKLVTLNQNSNQRAPDATSFFPVGGMPTASSLAWRLLSKSQDAVALQQIKERGALPMIDRGDIRQAIDRCSNIWASLPGAGYGQFEHKTTAWLQNSKKRAERCGWCMSRVTAIISALVICIIVCLSWAVNRTGDNAITYKAQRDKNARELKLANAAITDMQMRQRDVAARCKIHRVSWC